MTTSGRHTNLFTIKTAIFLLLCLIPSVYGWDNDDLELFDLVEEVNGNFYDLLEVTKGATSAEIKKAYRKKTLLLHPDKNEAEDAEIQFRKLVAVYEVLKDEVKREKYDAVLENGLPDWRQPVFYYRKARKLGLWESALILGLVITVGQYFVLWASYLEKRLSLESLFQSKMKRDKRGKKATAINEQIETDMQEVLNSLPTPSVRRLWPVTLVKMIIYIPTLVREIQARKRAEREWIERQKAEEKEQEEEMNRLKEEFEQRKLRKKNRVVEVESLPEEEEVDVTPVFYGSVKQTDYDDTDMKYTQKVGEWTDEDYVNLSKAYIRFPGGTTNRWEKIAEMVGRPVAEVTKKSKEMKGNMQMNLSSTVQGGTKHTKKSVDIKDDIISTADQVAFTDTDDSNKLRKRHKPTKDSARTLLISNQDGADLGRDSDSYLSNGVDSSHKEQSASQDPGNKSSNQSVKNSNAIGGKLVIKKSVNKEVPKDTSRAPKLPETEKQGADSENWSQNQQVILEWALRQYPKGTDQRWEKIADQIPGKTKEDCIARFKHLADLVKQKKQTASS